jgi:hypothetical protein
MVLLQFSIVVKAVKSVYLNKKCEAAPSYEGGIPYYYNYNWLCWGHKARAHGSWNTDCKVRAHGS